MDEKSYLEVDLPAYLQLSIDDYKEGVRLDLNLRIDALWADLYSSINIAFWDREISDEQAKYLRDKYLGI